MFTARYGLNPCIIQVNLGLSSVKSDKRNLCFANELNKLEYLEAVLVQLELPNVVY